MIAPRPWLIGVALISAGCTQPPDDLGRPVPVLAEMPRAVLAYTRCVDTLNHCRTSGLVRSAHSLTECLATAPVCRADDDRAAEPNGCCPQACLDLARSEQRTRSDDEAYREVFTTPTPPPCFVGAAEGLLSWKAENERLNVTVNRPAMKAYEERQRERARAAH